MPLKLKSFKIRSGKKILDYRLGKSLNLDEIRIFFQSRYEVKKLWNGNRHILGILKKDNTEYFLKLSTSEGISVVTRNEYNWNNYFNKYFLDDNKFTVPKNYDSGLYRNKYFYLITDYFKGKLLCNTSENASGLTRFISDIILLSEIIQKIPASDINYQSAFIKKTKNWFNDIPAKISKKYHINTLMEIVEKGTRKLLPKQRHGDFTPWHIIRLSNNKFGLIDGEHASSSGVEGYDICYFIQRVFSVLKNSDVAGKIYLELLERNYQKDKLKTILAARAIGGFLDESLANNPDYTFADRFGNWVIGKGSLKD